MTTGTELKSTLGLDNIKTVYITRLILGTAQKICVVFYDSRRPITHKNRIKEIPFTSMSYNGRDLSKGEFEVPTMTPVISIEDWNGIIQNYIFTVVDVSYSKFLSKKNFTKLPESVQKYFNEKSGFTYIGKEALKELTIADLRDKGNIAPSTMDFRKERNKLMGNEARNAKLIDLVIDQAGKSVTFQFLTETTPKYPSDYKYKQVDPKKLSLKNNPSKTYELQIKVLDFFEWLNVFEGETITTKEIKEIFEVSDIQVFSTSPSYQYQGYNYEASQLDASIYPTNIPSKVWMPKIFNGDYVVDKHLYGLLQSFKFFEQQMASMLNKKLKDRGLI